MYTILERMVEHDLSDYMLMRYYRLLVLNNPWNGGVANNVRLIILQSVSDEHTRLHSAAIY